MSTSIPLSPSPSLSLPPFLYRGEGGVLPDAKLRRSRRLWLNEALSKYNNRLTLRQLLGEIRAKSAKSRRLVLRREIVSMGNVLMKLGLVESKGDEDLNSNEAAPTSKKNNKKKKEGGGIGQGAIVTLKGMTAVELNQEGR